MYIGVKGNPDTNRIGEIRKNKSGTSMKIVAYRNSDDIDVEFQDEFRYVKTTTYSNFKIGQIKNPYDRDLYGVGYHGVGKWKVKDETGKWSRVYLCWRHMLERCYHAKSAHQYPAYYGICTVCEEWKCFQTFAEWYKAREYECKGRLHLDKDIKCPGNTVYSPETCMLVPQEINALFMNKANNRGLPNGVSRRGSKYFAKYNNVPLGNYNTVEDAYKAYSDKKKETIISLANEYKTVMPQYVYDIIVSYEFDIRNDKNYKAS